MLAVCSVVVVVVAAHLTGQLYMMKSVLDNCMGIMMIAIVIAIAIDEGCRSANWIAPVKTVVDEWPRRLSETAAGFQNENCLIYAQRQALYCIASGYHKTAVAKYWNTISYLKRETKNKNKKKHCIQSRLTSHC